MKNILLIGTAIFLSYKLGEKKAQMSAQDYFITRRIEPSPGVSINEYVQFSPTGVQFTQDESQATPFYFFDALNLKNLIRKFNPGDSLRLETVNNSIAA